MENYNSQKTFQTVKLQEMHKSICFAEIVQSSLQYYSAQTWSWDTIPAYGSLVISADRQVWGMVYDVQTAPQDPLRIPKALQLSEEELKRNHPQIFNFLTTTFSAIVLGFGKEPVFYQFSPFAPKLHSFIKMADPEEEKLFFKDSSYLHVLFENSNLITNMNELILAIISRYQKLGLLNKDFIEEFIDLLSSLYGNDYNRLNLLLKRIDNLIK